MRMLSHLGAALALILAFHFGTASAQQSPGATPRIDEHAIGGTVTGAQGPEAGVRVIAETTGLPTKFTKIVVTDERGRYVIPDLTSGPHPNGVEHGCAGASRDPRSARISLGFGKRQQMTRLMPVSAVPSEDR
jgi:hypothetical protein